MAGWQEVDFGDGFRVNVGSRSWWRWRWAKLRHIPYFVGDHPRFTFEVEGSEGGAPAYWALYTAGSVLDESDSASGENNLAEGRRDITMPMLATSGEYGIAIGLFPVEPAIGRDETVAYAFSVVTREGFIVKFLAPMVFGIGSLTFAVLNWVK